jgi:hypothetical protein
MTLIHTTACVLLQYTETSYRLYGMKCMLQFLRRQDDDRYLLPVMPSVDSVSAQNHVLNPLNHVL